MNRIKFLHGTIVLLLFSVIVSCQSRLQQDAEDFFKAYNNEDFRKIKSMALPEYSTEVSNLAKNIFSAYGKITEHSFILEKNIYQEHNKLSQVLFKCKTQTGKVFYMSINFFQEKSGDVPYISGFYTNENLDLLKNAEAYDQQVTKILHEFYKSVINSEYENILPLLNKDVFPIDENQVASMIKSIESDYGHLKKYKVFSSYPVYNDGKVYFVKKIECLTDKGNHFEQIVFLKNGKKFEIYAYEAKEL